MHSRAYNCTRKFCHSWWNFRSLTLLSFNFVLSLKWVFKPLIPCEGSRRVNNLEKILLFSTWNFVNWLHELQEKFLHKTILHAGNPSKHRSWPYIIIEQEKQIQPIWTVRYIFYFQLTTILKWNPLMFDSTNWASIFILCLWYGEF